MNRVLAALLATIRKLSKGLSDMQTSIKALASGFHYKGSVATVSALPSGASVGDMYTVEAEDNAQYVWDGSSWQNLFPTITKEQIDTLYE